MSQTPKKPQFSSGRSSLVSSQGRGEKARKLLLAGKEELHLNKLQDRRLGESRS